LTRRFGGFVALDDVSFEIGRGEIVGFLGPNGAGKTTTLRILAGYLPASSGVARVAGFDVLRQSLEVRRRIGYLAESVPLYREHRVSEMLEFQGRLHGISRADLARRIPRVLERVGLADRQRAIIGSLSRGLRQRVGLALALLPEPEVLILDEPTSGLDPLQRMEVRGVIRELAAQHTILLSSHILPEVEAVSSRVIIIHKGRIAADGSREELVHDLTRESHVRLEAVLGADPEAALRLLRSIPGVREVVHRGRRGIHHDVDIRCAVDLREEVGALALQRGWALRELSWQQPTLEEIFARIALSLGEDAGCGSASASAPKETARAHEPRVEPPGPPSAKATSLDVLPSDAPAPSKVVYNLNPFDRGATRDLGRPKAVESPAPRAPDRDGADERGGSSTSAPHSS
jgi:ABC-2 type transport system ATP-binding protein